MSYKTLYSICAIFCLCACADDPLSNPDPAASPQTGEPIQATLVLTKAQLQGPGEKTIGTKNAGSAPVLKASFSGMDVELSGTPAADTRAVADADADKISSAFILQFEGNAANSPCSQISYITATSTGVIDLNSFAFKPTASPISRIVVIANLDADALSLDSWNDGYHTYQSLLGLFVTRSNNPKISSNFLSSVYPLYEGKPSNAARSLLVGFTDVKLENGKKIEVILRRIFAKAQFNITITPAMRAKYEDWTAELMNLPENNYLIPFGRSPVFPTAEMLGSNGYYSKYLDNAELKGLTGSLPPSYNLPVNIYPDIPNATQETRSVLGPRNATYLQIIGSTTNEYGFTPNKVSYHLFLGSDFEGNYSISPNYKYNYTINIIGESGEDGSVIKFIPGKWGGEIIAYNSNGDRVVLGSTDARKWEYKRPMELYTSDINSITDGGAKLMNWGNFGLPNLPGNNSLSDGFSNTREFKQNYALKYTTFTASAACTFLNNSQPKSPNEWYLPSIRQMMAAYVVAANLKSGLSPWYWSSSVTPGNYAYRLSRLGEVQAVLTNQQAYVRPARSLGN